MEVVIDRPREMSRIATLVANRVEELKGVKTQREIAERAGYRSQNMITMLKLGDSKVSLDRVPDLAAALEVDERKLLILALEQFYSPAYVQRMVRILSGEAPKK